MDTSILKHAEQIFLAEYPGGFEHPEMVAIGKKHKMDKLEKFAKDSFAKKNFDDPDLIVTEVSKLVSRSSMISMFEKPKFKNMTAKLSQEHKQLFVRAVYELLHGKEKAGFELFLHELEKRKLARWTFATCIQAYYRPQKEVLIKPNTTKLIIHSLDLGLSYNPKPTWDFYRKYRKEINSMKTLVNKNLAPNNPAFCGFLMITLPKINLLP